MSGPVPDFSRGLVAAVVQDVESGEVLMVGDSVSDVKAAKEAGVAMAAVLWDSYGRDRVLETDASHFFHSVEEFSDWLKAAIPRDGERAN